MIIKYLFVLFEGLIIHVNSERNIAPKCCLIQLSLSKVSETVSAAYA